MNDPAAPAPLGRRLLTVIAVLAVVVVIASSDALHAPALRLVRWIEAGMAAWPVAGKVLFVAASALSAMLAFLSSTILVPSAVAQWGVVTTTVLLWVGWLVGGVTAWTIGARLAGPAADRLLPATLSEKLRARLGPSTPFTLVLLLQLALPSELPGYLLGIVRHPLRRYVPALALAELPFAIGAVLLAQGFLARRTAVLGAVGLLAIVALAAVHAVLRRRLESRR